MATLEAALVSILEDDSGVGAIAGDRIYALVLPQGVVYPAIRWQRISTPRLKSTSGPSGRARPRFQIDCYAGTHAEALSLAAAVRAALDGFSGTVAAVVISSSGAEDEGSDFEPDVGASGVYRERLDFLISHTE